MSNVSMIDGYIDEPRMTDNEIIKALECCAVMYDCPDCPFECDCGNMGNLSTAAIDLINRQKAEIERLKKDKYNFQKALNQSEDYRLIAKAEGAKEVIERLKEEATVDDDMTWWIANVDIDKVLKEMVGE